MGGPSRALTIAQLPIDVGGIVLLQQFWIVSNFPYNLLGAPWMKDTKAVIDCQKQTAVLRVGQDETHIELYEGIRSPPMVLTSSIEAPTPQDMGGICPDAATEHRDNIQQILERNSAAWRCPQLGKCTTLCHKIDTGSARPIAMKPRKLSPEKQQEVKRRVSELMDAGAIENAKRPWAAPLVLVSKRVASGECVLTFEN